MTTKESMRKARNLLNDIETLFATNQIDQINKICASLVFGEKSDLDLHLCIGVVKSTRRAKDTLSEWESLRRRSVAYLNSKGYDGELILK